MSVPLALGRVLSELQYSISIFFFEVAVSYILYKTLRIFFYLDLPAKRHLTYTEYIVLSYQSYDWYILHYRHEYS